MRITIPDFMRLCEEQTDGKIKASDFYPVPAVVPISRAVSALQKERYVEFTAHPHCGMATYIFVEEGDMLYTRPGDPQLEDLQQEAIRVLERHPNLTVIFAHFFFIDDELGRARALLDDYPNMYLDTTQHWEMYVNFNAQREGAREFFMDFQDRIVFGSDNVFGNYRDGIWSDEFAARNHQFMKQYFSSDDTMPDDFPPLAMKGFAPPGTVIRGLDLPDNVLRKFYHANFERIAGKRPAPLPE